MHFSAKMKDGKTIDTHGAVYGNLGEKGENLGVGT